MIRIFAMTNDNVAVYAQFLAQCREVVGPFDIERLAYDQEYKTKFFNSIAISADDELFEMAALVSRKLREEIPSVH
jgi:hypothetical protein